MYSEPHQEKRDVCFGFDGGAEKSRYGSSRRNALSTADKAETLYPLLTRLKNAEILSYRWEESTGGPPRKYYKLTEKGELFIAELDKTWNQLIESVTQITKNQ